jgi:tetratricopeptide (TPR) repeat protein
MVWENPYDSKFEAELTFPLPEGGVVCGYSVDIENILVPGVIVTKEKARATFEAEVRKDRGGPALIEQSVGNVFNTRINPFLPLGSRTIQVLFTQDLLPQREALNKTANIYTLPFLTPISSSCYATMSISVPGNFIPRIISQHPFLDERTDRSPQWCQTKDDQIGKYLSTFSGVSPNCSITSPFILSLTASDIDSSIIIDHCGSNTISIAAAITEIPLGSPSSPSLTSSWSTTRIGVLWDTSKSRDVSDTRIMEANALEAICRHFDSQSIEMDVFTFNTTPSSEPRRFFSKHLVEAANILRTSDGITYHGGTNYYNLNQLVGSQMGALGSLFSSYQFWIVFTDGISTFGSQQTPDLQAPCFILSGASSGDHAFLRRWARSSNGKFWNLHTNSHADIIKGFTDHSVSFLYASLSGFKLTTETVAVDTREPEVDPLKPRIMIVPSVPKPLDAPKLRFYARLDFTHPKLAELLVSENSSSRNSDGDDSSFDLTIHFGVASTVQVTHTKTFAINVKQVLAMGIPKPVAISERAWAQGRLAEVQVQLESLGSVESVEKQQLEKEQLALSRHFTIVTPNTSLIVLETLQQFLDHMICPPMALPEIYKQYNKRIAARVAEEESKRFEKTSRVHTWWLRRQKWADHHDLAHQRVLKDPETGIDEYDIAFRTHGISLQDFKANRQILHFAEFGSEEMNDLPITARDHHNQPWHFAMPEAKRWPGAQHERPPQRPAIGLHLNPSHDSSWDVFFPTIATGDLKSIMRGLGQNGANTRINNAIHLLSDRPSQWGRSSSSRALPPESGESESVDLLKVSKRGRSTKGKATKEEEVSASGEDDSRTTTFCGGVGDEIELTTTESLLAPEEPKASVDGFSFVRKPHRYRPGTVALREIRAYKKEESVDLEPPADENERDEWECDVVEDTPAPPSIHRDISLEDSEEESMGYSLFGGDSDSNMPAPPIDLGPQNDADDDDDMPIAVPSSSSSRLSVNKNNTSIELKKKAKKMDSADFEAPATGKRRSQLAAKKEKKTISKAERKALDAVNFDEEFRSESAPREDIFSKDDLPDFSGFTYTPAISEARAIAVPESLPLDGLDGLLDFGAALSAEAPPPPPREAKPVPIAPQSVSRSGRITESGALQPSKPVPASRKRRTEASSNAQDVSLSLTGAISAAAPTSKPTAPLVPRAPFGMAGPAQPRLSQMLASPVALSSPAPISRQQAPAAPLPKTESAKNRFVEEDSRLSSSLESYDQKQKIQRARDEEMDQELDRISDSMRNVNSISKDAADINEMFSSLRTELSSQSVMLDQIDSSIMPAQDLILEAQTELSEAAAAASFGKKVVGGLWSLMGGKQTESSPSPSSASYMDVPTTIPTFGFNQEYSALGAEEESQERFRSISKRSRSTKASSASSSSSTSPSSSISSRGAPSMSDSPDPAYYKATINFANTTPIAIAPGQPQAAGCMGGGSGGGGGGASYIASAGESSRESNRRITRSSKKSIEEISGDIERVKETMLSNIDQVLSRGERLETLDARSDLLSAESFTFKRSANQLKRRMWWRNVKIFGFLFLALLLLLAGSYYTYQHISTIWEFITSIISASWDFITSSVPGILPNLFGIGQQILAIPSYISSALFTAGSYAMHYPVRLMNSFARDITPNGVSENGWSWTSAGLLLLPIISGFILAVPLGVFKACSSFLDERHRLVGIIYLHPLVLLEYIARAHASEPSSWATEIAYFARWFQMWTVVWWLLTLFVGKSKFVSRFSLALACLFVFHAIVVVVEAIGRYFGSAAVRMGLAFFMSNIFDFLVIKNAKIAKYADYRDFVNHFVVPNILSYGLVSLLYLFGLPIEIPLVILAAGVVWKQVVPQLSRKYQAVAKLMVIAVVGIGLLLTALYWLGVLFLMFLSPSDLGLSVVALVLFVGLALRTNSPSEPATLPSEIPIPDLIPIQVGKEVALQLEKPVPREVKRAREFSILSDVDYSALPVANSPMMNQYDLVQFERPRFAFIDSTPEGTGRRILSFKSKFEVPASSQSKYNALALEEAKKRYKSFVESRWLADETSHINLIFELFSLVVEPNCIKRTRAAASRMNLDAAASWTSNGDSETAFALTALSNLAEGHLGKVQLLRAMAYHLEAAGALEEAVSLYRRVLEMRGEEPQSYRDLALVLAELKQFDECISLYDRILTRCKPDWDARFSQIEIVALTDLCGILPRMSALEVASGCKIPYAVVPAAAQPLQVDLRAVLTWDVDGLDLELQVLEPSGDVLNSFANQSATGGMLSRDFSGGYGPVEYLAKRATPGLYAFRAKCRSPCTKPILGGQVTIRFTLYTNYGLPEQTSDTHVLRVTPSMGQLIPLACTSASL